MIYSQNDSRWKNEYLGFSDVNAIPKDSIGNYGCYLTAIANVCEWTGKSVDPLTLNGIIKDKGWFTDDLINNNQIPALLYPDALEFVEAKHWSDVTDMTYFSDASDPNTVYIIELDASPAQGIQTHFTMVWASTGEDLIIDDSWDGVRKHLSFYGNPSVIIQAAYKFRKKDKVEHATADEVKQAYQEIVNRAPTGDEITQWTQNGNYKEMITGLLPASVVGPQNDQINKLIAQVGTLNGQISLLTFQNKDLQDKVSKLALDKSAAESSAQMLQDELTAARAQGVKPSFVQQLAQYNKFWVALAGVGVTVLTQHFGVGSTIVTDAVAVLSALGVVIVPNKN